MYTLYSINPSNFVMTKVSDGGVGQLRLQMNALKNTNKSMIYALYRGPSLVSSMLNK